VGLSYHASVQNLSPNQDLLIIGGAMNWCPGKDQQSAKIYSYDKSTNQFTESTQFPSLPYPLWKASAMFDFRGRLFVVGNLKEKSETRVLYYENAKWNEAPIDRSRIGAATTIDQTKTRIYFVGGSVNGSANSSTVVFLDTGLMSWNLAPDMWAPRFGHAAAYHDNWIYVCGGEQPVAGSDYPLTDAKCKKLDTTDQTSWVWNPILRMSSPRSAFSLVPYYEKLVVVTGFSNQDQQNHTQFPVEILDPKTDSWVTGNQDGPKNLAGASVAFMPGFPTKNIQC